MKILAFAATTSRKSINQQLVTYAANLIDNTEIEIIDLNDYELPLFSEDREAELGQPQLAHDFLQKIKQSDALIISFAEHNGSYTAAYKNTFDWASRINAKVFQNKPMIMLSTSPGAGGGANVLAAATSSAPYFAGRVQGSLSVASFYDNFDIEKGILTDSKLNSQLQKMVQDLTQQELLLAS